LEHGKGTRNEDVSGAILFGSFRPIVSISFQHYTLESSYLSFTSIFLTQSGLIPPSALIFGFTQLIVLRIAFRKFDRRFDCHGFNRSKKLTVHTADFKIMWISLGLCNESLVSGDACNEDISARSIPIFGSLG
jgi:hypothetical protein